MQNSPAERSNNIKFTSSAFVQLTLHNTIEDDDEPGDEFPTEAPVSPIQQPLIME
jgi:hypothetical protein